MKKGLFLVALLAVGSLVCNAKPKKLTSTIKYDVTPEGVLVIEGTGALPDWPAPQAEAWYKDKAWHKISRIEIGEGITRIGFKSFSPTGQDFKRAKPLEISLPSSLREIGDFAFKGTTLSDVELPEGLVEIGLGAFIGSLSQTTLEFPKTMKSVAEGAFQKCNIVSVIFTSDVVVGQGAFFECPSLRTVNFNNTWTELAGASFEGNHSLTELNNSDNVRLTSGNPFIRTPLEKSPVVAHMANPHAAPAGAMMAAASDAPAKENAAPAVVSELDLNIPVMDGIDRDNTFVLIMGNEHYRREAAVPYANNDAAIFGEYVTKTLGIPDKNVTLIKDATLNDMKYGLNTLARISKAYEGNVNFIVYYAGHGVPDEATRDAFLLPVDGYGADPSTGYPISSLYDRLSAIPSNGAVLFMDACFSGSKREGDMMASARAVAIAPKAAKAQGNLIVFSAASGEETAFGFDDEGHGLFTYYLLKKLQQNMGDVSLGELSDYIISEVKKSSIVVNKKPQTPTVTVSDQLDETWRNIKL